jgi:hypothetical protein
MSNKFFECNKVSHLFPDKNQIQLDFFIPIFPKRQSLDKQDEMKTEIKTTEQNNCVCTSIE